MIYLVLRIKEASGFVSPARDQCSVERSRAMLKMKVSEKYRFVR